MSNPIEQAAQVLAKHDPTTVRLADGLHNACLCTWIGDRVADQGNRLIVQRHVAQALADAGLLPTEVQQRHRCDNITGWEVDERSCLSKDCEGGHPETQRRYVTDWRPADE